MNPAIASVVALAALGCAAVDDNFDVVGRGLERVTVTDQASGEVLADDCHFTRDRTDSTPGAVVTAAPGTILEEHVDRWDASTKVKSGTEPDPSLAYWCDDSNDFDIGPVSVRWANCDVVTGDDPAATLLSASVEPPDAPFGPGDYTLVFEVMHAGEVTLVSDADCAAGRARSNVQLTPFVELVIQ